jgi:hypothetical protein
LLCKAQRPSNANEAHPAEVERTQVHLQRTAVPTRILRPCLAELTVALPADFGP